MASLIWLGNLYGSQEPVKAHYSESIWNLDEDIRGYRMRRAIIAKGNILAGIEART